jgi:hypothetical protein
MVLRRVLAALPFAFTVLASPAASAADQKAEEPPFEAKETGEWPQYGCDAGCRFATTGGIASTLRAKWVFKRQLPAAKMWFTAAKGDRVLVECTGDQNGDAKIGDPANNPYLFGIDFETGAKAWEWSHKHDWGIGCPIAIAGSLFYYNDDGFGWIDFEKGGGTDMGQGADSWGYVSVDEKAGLVVKACDHKVDNDGSSIEAYPLGQWRKWQALRDDGVKAMHGGDGYAFHSLCQGAGKVFVAVSMMGGSPKKTKNGLHALSQADGSEAWCVEGEWGGVSFDGEHVYSSLRDARDPKAWKLCCLNPADGKTAWSANVGEPVHHPPAHGRGICLVITDSGALYAFPSVGDQAGKKLAWQGHVDAPFAAANTVTRNSALAIAEGGGKNGVLVVAAGKGVHLFDLKRGAPMGDLPWDASLGSAMNPLIVNGNVIVNGGEGVVCYGPPAKKDKPKQ